MSDGHNLEAHLFVCTNQKEKGACCAGRGSIELRNKLKEICQDPSRGWHGRVRVNTAGCLGRCADGIAAVLYPDGQWFTGLKPGDEGVIAEALSRKLDRK